MKRTWTSNFGVHSFLEIQPHSIYVLSTASSELWWQSCVVVTSTLRPENLKDFLSGLLQKRSAACYLCTCCLLSPECPSLACPQGQSPRSRGVSSRNPSFPVSYRVSSSQCRVAKSISLWLTFFMVLQSFLPCRFHLTPSGSCRYTTEQLCIPSTQQMLNKWSSRQESREKMCIYGAPGLHVEHIVICTCNQVQTWRSIPWLYGTQESNWVGNSHKNIL